MVIPDVICDPKHVCAGVPQGCNLSPQLFLVEVYAGVPQGSILGPLLFLVYINDIVKENESNINLFSDETCLSMVVGNPNAAGTILQNDINKVIFWID